MESASNCIFCTSQCTSTFTIVDGKPVKLIKSEFETENLLGNCETSDNSNSERKLKVILILRKILNIEKEACSKFLEDFEGQLYKKFWLSVCPSCDKLVSEFREKLGKIRKLERRLKGIRTALTGFVQNTQSFDGLYSVENGPIWNEIRKKIVTDFATEVNKCLPLEDQAEQDDDDDSIHSLQQAGDSNFEVSTKVEVDYSSSDEDLNEDNLTIENNIESEPQQQEVSSPPPKKRKPYIKCAECGDLSFSLIRFKHHSQLHKLNKGVVCPDCGWRCGSLPTHIASWHPGSGSRLTMEERLENREIRVMKITDDDDNQERNVEEDTDAYEIVKRKGKRRLYRCKLCPAINPKLSGILKHLAGHKNGIPCEECGWIVEKTRMGFHFGQIHRKKLPKLNKTPKKPVATRFRHHCSECKASYWDMQSLRDHKKLHESGKGVVCDECGCFVSKLKTHKLRKHGPGTEKKRDDEQEVNVVVSEEIPYYCDHCHMIFPFLSRFLVHHKCYHANEPVLDCGQCESKFESKQLLKLHLGRDHGQMEEIPKEESQPQQCQCCFEEFQSKMKRDLHIAKDHQDKLLSCNACNVAFTRFSDYQTHMEATRAHANKKMFACELCGKAYNNSGLLKDHRLQEHYEELGLEPHRCSYCGNVLANKASLDRHIRSQHTKQFKLTCEYCGKGFNAQHRLQQHISVRHKEVDN